MLDEHAADERLQIGLKVRAALERIGKLLKALGNRRVEHDVDAGNGGRGARHTELEFVAGKGEGRGAVAVGRVLGEARQRVHADLHQLSFLAAVGRLVNDRVEDLLDLVADVHRNDRRRRLVRAEAVIVCGRRHADAQHILIVVHGLNDRAQEQQELRVFRRCLAGLKQVHAGVGGQRPVVVLAGTVDAGKRLFMQQADHAVARGHLLHDLHRQLVLVSGDVAGRKHGRELVLRGRDFIVLGLGIDAELPELLIEILHECRNARLDAAEIVIVKLLTFRRLCAEERAPGVDQILAAVIDIFVHEEILLLGADRRAHGGHVRVAEQVDHAQSLTVERLRAAQQRRLFIERLTAVGAERRRDAQNVILDEGIGRRIPRGIAARFKRRAQAAGREAGSIRLAADKLLAGKLHDHLTAAARRDEAVMLLGGDAGHRLEPVREVRRALLDRPVLHGIGHDARCVVIETFALFHRRLHLPVGLLRQPLAHDCVVKYHRAKNVRDLIHFPGPLSMFQSLCQQRKNGTGARRSFALHDAIAVSMWKIYACCRKMSSGSGAISFGGFHRIFGRAGRDFILDMCKTRGVLYTWIFDWKNSVCR